MIITVDTVRGKVNVGPSFDGENMRVTSISASVKITGGEAPTVEVAQSSDAFISLNGPESKEAFRTLDGSLC